ncbi:DUF397 domain-containing protein [Streptomyces sp. NPDC048392]|uniref:DUF397 domain-containing protein n=1 Tax=Streptomyces sp. NPDC048392 TaxID=3365543 RepID=UPI00371E282E
MRRKDTSQDVTDLTRFTSSYSDSSDPNDCVEVAMTPATIHIRDSKRLEGPCMATASTAWTAFVAWPHVSHQPGQGAEPLPRAQR